MRYTAEEVRHCARYINRAGSIGYEGMYAKASDMLTTYADDLERREAGVTEETVRVALAAYDSAVIHWPSETTPNERMRCRIRAALLAVWPVAAEPVGKLSDMPIGSTIRCRKCGEQTAIAFNYAGGTGECCNHSPCAHPGVGPCDRPAKPAQPADSGRVGDEVARALCAKFDELGYGYPNTDDAKLAIAAALAAQQEQITDGKAQWDEVAGILGADGDNVDDVTAKARALAAHGQGEPVGYCKERDLVRLAQQRKQLPHNFASVMVVNRPGADGYTVPLYTHPERTSVPEARTWITARTATRSNIVIMLREEAHELEQYDEASGIRADHEGAMLLAAIANALEDDTLWAVDAAPQPGEPDTTQESQSNG